MKEIKFILLLSLLLLALAVEQQAGMRLFVVSIAAQTYACSEIVVQIFKGIFR